MSKMNFCSIILLFTLTGMGAFPFSLRAQDEARRKAKKEPKPEYPSLARTMHISGVVKIEVTITPEGKVKIIRVIGGHPLLVPAAEQAAKQWEFEAGSKLSTQVIDFKFENPDSGR